MYELIILTGVHDSSILWIKIKYVPGYNLVPINEKYLLWTLWYIRGFSDIS